MRYHTNNISTFEQMESSLLPPTEITLIGKAGIFATVNEAQFKNLIDTFGPCNYFNIGVGNTIYHPPGNLPDKFSGQTFAIRVGTRRTSEVISRLLGHQTIRYTADVSKDELDALLIRFRVDPSALEYNEEFSAAPGARYTFTNKGLALALKTKKCYTLRVATRDRLSYADFHDLFQKILELGTKVEPSATV